MSKPIDHARISASKFGGVPEDYLDIHVFMDSSKEAFADVRHRVLTHNSWFITNILPLKFGEVRENSGEIEYSVRDIGEQHCLDDFDNLFIPTAQDFIAEMELQPWMDNARDGEVPPSRRKAPKEKQEPAVQRAVRREIPDSWDERSSSRCGPGVMD